jgi:hypothetical protein
MEPMDRPVSIFIPQGKKQTARKGIILLDRHLIYMPMFKFLEDEVAESSSKLNEIGIRVRKIR